MSRDFFFFFWIVQHGLCVILQMSTRGRTVHFFFYVCIKLNVFRCTKCSLVWWESVKEQKPQHLQKLLFVTVVWIHPAVFFCTILMWTNSFAVRKIHKRAHRSITKPEGLIGAIVCKNHSYVSFLHWTFYLTTRNLFC